MPAYDELETEIMEGGLCTYCGACVASCLSYYGMVPPEAMITGGEPTLDKAYLLCLVKGLREKGFKEIVLMTNGYALGRMRIMCMSWKKPV